MIIKSIYLRNIRSYVDETIKFPSGSVLLWGDIGSGKSSILLAIEFALFGTRRKHLSGQSLLRKGKKEGCVELDFSLGKKDIVIKRVLKRAKDDVKQDTGYILIDGKKKEGTATELKAWVLQLLGYPRDMITKSKDIIYRYTVYTPQEEMKHILTEDKDLRLDTLRKVFQIDKYKRIRENSLIMIKEAKNRINHLNGRTEDIEEKKRQKREREQELKEISRKIYSIKPKYKLAADELSLKKKMLIGFEEKIKKLNLIKAQLDTNDVKLNNLIEQRQRIKIELENIREQAKRLEKELGDKELPDPESLEKEVKEKKKQIHVMENLFMEINNKITEINTKSSGSAEIKDKIMKLDNCPLCLQDVNPEHKHSIISEEDKKLGRLKEEKDIHIQQREEALAKINVLKKELEDIEKRASEIHVIKIKSESLQEKLKTEKDLAERIGISKKDIGKINMEKIRLGKELEQAKDTENDYAKAKEELDELAVKEKDLAIKTASLEKESEGISKLINILNDDIKEKERLDEQAKKLKKSRDWLDGFFIKAMSIMEKQVMLTIYHEFNDLFQDWFNILIEEETLSVRLDEEFTPVIEQNGYDTELENLSGGEKTACALAYRLALNKVINDVVKNIKTNDLIMLDEPTDGFSTEQLDKVRDVLEQLSIKQAIIVSHESKVESFVDNVIRIHKQDHTSHVV